MKFENKNEKVASVPRFIKRHLTHIDRILAATIKDPVGPEFLAPPEC